MVAHTPVHLEWVQPLLPDIAAGAMGLAAERGTLVEDVNLVAAVAFRETWVGRASGYLPEGSPDGTGDGGHGHGYWQVDDRGAYAYLIEPAPWAIARQARAACLVLADARRDLAEFRKDPLFERAVVCRYNASLAHVRDAMRAHRDPDSVTTAGPSKKPDYGSDVLWVRDRLAELRGDGYSM